MFLITKGSAPKPICRVHLTAGVCQKCATIRREALTESQRVSDEQVIRRALRQIRAKFEGKRRREVDVPDRLFEAVNRAWTREVREYARARNCVNQ